MGKKKGGLTDEQKAKIKQDFLDLSGGFHPGEAGDEREQFQGEWGSEYGEDELDAFLEEWGEEESKKDSEAHEADQARRANAFKKSMQKLASSFVRLNDAKTAVIVHMPDPSDPNSGLVLKMPDRETQQEAKAEAADVMWAVQLLLERGAIEGSKSGIVGDFEELLKR
jgi:hypothetical protein